MKHLIFLTIMVATPTFADQVPYYESVVVGRPNQVRVIDADTLEILNTKIRLNGINAAERGHKSYNKARAWVKALINRSDLLECGLTGQKTYDRHVGGCYVINGDQKIDLQAAIVAAGFARDCERYSGGRYAEFETAASKALPEASFCKIK